MRDRDWRAVHGISAMRHVVVALGLFACDSGHGGTLIHVTPEAAESGARRHAASDAGDAADAPPSSAVCGLGPPGSLPDCADGVQEGADCDGSVVACRSRADAGGSDNYVCQKLSWADRSIWRSLFLVSGSCADRAALPCETAPGTTAQEFVDGQFETIMVSCLGVESTMSVSITDGCATFFTASPEKPEGVSCLRAGLAERRYACAEQLSCSLVSHSLVAH